MAGICGIVGCHSGVEEMSTHLHWTGRESEQKFKQEDISVTIVYPNDVSVEQPLDWDRKYHWLFGEVYGFQDAQGYESFFDTKDDNQLEYVAKKYKEYGADAGARLNGEFSYLTYEPESDSFVVATDRLGSRPIYFTVIDGIFVFTSNIQAISAYSDHDFQFALPYLHEFFAIKRSLGIKTPIDGVQMVPPGSRTTFNLDAGEYRTESYWRPIYTPGTKSYEEFLDSFVTLIQDVVEERMRDEGEYGLFLSGGSDSRLVMAAANKDITAFHLADWANREAEIARTSAETAGAEFQLLERNIDYQARALDVAPAVSNFISNFQQAHVSGFLGEFTDIDIIMSGQFADTFFKGHFLPNPAIRIGSSSVEFPVEKRFKNLDGYISYIAEETPRYLRTEIDIKQVLRENIATDESGIVNHGIRYDSLRDMTLFSEYYPLTNQPDYFFYEALYHLARSRSPFIDNRLIDLHLSIPTKYYIRRNIINDALEQLAPELAKLPHPNTGLALTRPLFAQYFGQKFRTLMRKVLGRESNLAYGHYTHRAWPNHDSLLREHDLGIKAIKENEILIRNCSLFDWQMVNTVWDEQVSGNDNAGELYPLFTFLKMPLVRSICEKTNDPQNNHDCLSTGDFDRVVRK